MAESESRCAQADMREALVAYLCEECEPDECRRVEAHLAGCPACTGELDALRAVRGGLGAWTAPEPEASIRVVSQERPARLRWRRLYDARWELATAAAVLLAVGVVLVGVEVRYGPDGLVVRLGLDREGVSQAMGEEPGATAPRDIVLVEAGPNAAGGRRPAPGQAQLMDRLQGMIEQSERRQQQELALWLSELAREFDVQRLADQQRVQQELDALEGYADYLVRVVGTPGSR